ncbi:uncharacterized protein JN550_001532 [Neoarthrinium moseri]|uniref:uncharacterized protein n=1 Tax=Neoarthrinium moseri TaxID=1658444 RepID=UPI001FDC73FB|nr:uncharacterized protein JN550_001532 [Neoarthrinium moseri]KAI1876036.1 hypothetical protein JN550_001532 [Neoarthrinium moseri]
MELTPIRIPGKRRRKGEPPLVFNVAPRKDKVKEKKTKNRKVVKPKASYLEKELPLEIMERIFWASENVNFPRSGPRVGHLLSGEPTRRETFLRAFAPTWEVWFGVFRDSHTVLRSYHGWQDDVARFGGNPDFQSALLQYSWVGISFILDCMDSWIQRYARSRFFQQRKLWGDPDTEHKIEDDSGGVDNYRSAREYFQHDYDAFCSKIGAELPPVNDETSWVEVHRDTQIPDGLLTGPWDEAAVQKLFWLVRAGARLSPDQTWETTLEGYQNAMASETEPPSGNLNLPVIRLLFMLGGNHWPEHAAKSELSRLHKREKSLRNACSADVYQKYAVVASMMVQRYSTSDTRG